MIRYPQISNYWGVCGLLRAKGFPRISPAGHILVLVPRFDREFVPTFQGHGSVGGKNGTRFEMNFVFNEFVPTFQGHGSVGGKNGTRFEMNFVFNEGLCLKK